MKFKPSEAKDSPEPPAKFFHGHQEELGGLINRLSHELNVLTNDVNRLVHEIYHLKEFIMSALSDLQAAVAAQTTVIDSVVTLLRGLKAALDAAGQNPAALAALSADIAAKTQVLSDAVVENTPAV